MPDTYEQQALAFLNSVAQQQDKLLSYALSLTKGKDDAHDLYSETLLKCRERIAAHGFNGEGFLAYMITSLKFNHFYAKRSNAKLDLLELQEAQAQDVGSTEERMALAAGVRAFIFTHFPQEEVAVFDLHLHGVMLEEIVFLSDYDNRFQVMRVIQKIKKGVRAAFAK